MRSHLIAVLYILSLQYSVYPISCIHYFNDGRQTRAYTEECSGTEMCILAIPMTEFLYKGIYGGCAPSSVSLSSTQSCGFVEDLARGIKSIECVCIDDYCNSKDSEMWEVMEMTMRIRDAKHGMCPRILKDLREDLDEEPTKVKAVTCDYDNGAACRIFFPNKNQSYSESHQLHFSYCVPDKNFSSIFERVLEDSGKTKVELWMGHVKNQSKAFADAFSNADARVTQFFTLNGTTQRYDNKVEGRKLFLRHYHRMQPIFGGFVALSVFASMGTFIVIKQYRDASRDDDEDEDLDDDDDEDDMDTEDHYPSANTLAEFESAIEMSSVVLDPSGAVLLSEPGGKAITANNNEQVISVGESTSQVTQRPTATVSTERAANSKEGSRERKKRLSKKSSSENADKSKSAEGNGTRKKPSVKKGGRSAERRSRSKNSKINVVDKKASASVSKPEVSTNEVLDSTAVSEKK